MNNCVRSTRGRVVSAYGNSPEDIPHLAKADHPMLVNGSARARALAPAQGIPCAPLALSAYSDVRIVHSSGKNLSSSALAR